MLRMCMRQFYWALSLISFLYKCILFVILLVLPSRYSKKLDIVATTFPRDLKLLIVAVRVFLGTRHVKTHNCTVYSEFRKTMLMDPHKVCFVTDDKVWTFKMVDVYAGKVANVFRDAGYRKGDVVALLISNCPEYVCLWLGLSRLGVISSFINVNLRGDSLKHCISVCGCKTLIFSEDLATSISEIRRDLGESFKLLQLSGPPKAGSNSLEIPMSEAEDFFAPREQVNCMDHLAYVYTSGTTGLPKAAIITHTRYLLFGKMCEALLGVRRSDKFYVSLPLYHVAGGLLCISTSTCIGTTCIIAKKFSASNFFPDCIKHKCTVAMFIGEMCRYILSQHGCSEDHQPHSLRTIISTGLRSSVWQDFSSRFGIKDIKEVYGATEGNVQLVNVDNKIGAIGFVPQCLPKKLRRSIATIVKCDSETLQPIRDTNGFCVECEAGEVGMLLGLIRNDNPSKMFYGYVGGNESHKKIIKGVYEEGDEAYVTGDLVVMDKYGYVFFKDRTGDTFRWKGENVSSFEVETVISKILGGRECIVYGVQVGDLEGKAGMVAIFDPERHVDLLDLVSFLEKDLPRYAIPVFVRLISRVDFTGTWRVNKVQLKKEGFDPNFVEDPLFFKQGKVYVELTKDNYDGILNGTILV